MPKANAGSSSARSKTRRGTSMPCCDGPAPGSLDRDGTSYRSCIDAGVRSVRRGPRGMRIGVVDAGIVIGWLQRRHRSYRRIETLMSACRRGKLRLAISVVNLAEVFVHTPE